MAVAMFLIALGFLTNIISTISAGLPQTWSYDVIEIATNTSNTDIADLKLEIVRLGRGQLGVSGFVDIKTDLYDNATIRITTERSVDRAGPYSNYPMSIENQTLTTFMNNYYKRLVQPTAEKCCENAPIIDSNFQQPLTKRYVKVDQCVLSTENLPNTAMESYYKFRVHVMGPAEVHLDVLTYISNDHF